MFSCEFCEIFKNTFFHRTPPLAASFLHLCVRALDTSAGFQKGKSFTFVLEHIYNQSGNM